jgi:putative glycerol-1-phosphate prenyltransferase
VQILDQLLTLKREQRKGIAILIDPDKVDEQSHPALLRSLEAAQPDLVFIGGSLITQERFDAKVKALRQAIDLPLVLFPGSPTQLTRHVDAVLFLSLISGRNPELLIGHHVTAAPRVRELGLEAIATGYMLIDGGMPTTASYISNTLPIPRDKPEIAAATAMAGELLGLRALYLDAGSGAALPVSSETIEAVRKATDLPLIVGGGIRTKAQKAAAYEAGADLIVIGTAFEEAVAGGKSEVRGQRSEV